MLDRSNTRQATIRVRENPCLPLSDLAGLIDQVIPEREVPAQATKHVKTFRGQVHDVAGRFLAAEDGLECGYQTDGLAIAVYQHTDNPWSVGVVVVVRLSVRAALDVGVCYLGKKLGVNPPGDQFRADGNKPAPEFCGMAARPKTGNSEDYAVVALGSSNWMCAALQTSRAGLVEVL